MRTAFLASAMASATIVLSGVHAGAGTILFDFESDEDIEAWSLRSPAQDTFERSRDFATSGASSAVFRSPAYREGIEPWPAFEAKPPVTDWTGYDRLVVDVTNPESDRPLLALFVTDGRTPFRQGLHYRFDIPSRGFRRAIVPLASFPDFIDRSDIALVHLYSERPAADLRLHLDGIALLRPGETMPDPPESFVRQTARLLGEIIRRSRLAIERCRQRVDEFDVADRARSHVSHQVGRLSWDLRATTEPLAAPGLTIADVDAIRSEVERIPPQCDRFMSILDLRTQNIACGIDRRSVLVSTASSMEKILPRHGSFPVRASRSIEISLARNEKESFQVLVFAIHNRQGMRISVTDLVSDAGDVFAADRIDCDVVGYVETRNAPPYEVSHVGWWPDPILDFLDPVNIAEGDLQSFWIRVRAPRDQPPGVYRGTLRIVGDNQDPVDLDLAVRVYAFALPDHAPLPTAISFGELRDRMGGEERWDEMRFVWADFLADYYIDYDSLYRQGAPDFDILRRLRDQGRLVAFNLGNVFNAGAPTEGFEAAVAGVVDRIRPAYDEAKALGLLDYAYIYGFDERGAEHFDALERSARALRAAFPEVPLMTTSYDHSYGLDSEVKTIDAWCPLTPHFDPERAAQAREAGRQVWWYICCAPHNPHANWFVEYDAIEARLLMGAMTAKYRPDGFLYYSLTKWNDNRPIEKGPFTSWDPVSWTTYHGDGSLICAGPGGKPVPTVRLENFRDGLEDYAYARILEEIVRQRAARGETLDAAEREWLDAARAALAVPETLVRDLAAFSRDPDELYAYRNRLAELIEQSPTP